MLGLFVKCAPSQTVQIVFLIFFWGGVLLFKYSVVFLICQIYVIVLSAIISRRTK